jgi:GAF domain-containing protein
MRAQPQVLQGDCLRVLVNQMSQRLYRQRSFEGAVNTLLQDAIALHGAELGNVQLVCGGGRLVIVAQRGFKTPFLECFRVVAPEYGCVCGRALSKKRTVVVEDTELDEEFAPYRAIARSAGFRGVVSTPLLARRHFLIGVVSTHFVNVHVPTRIELEAIQSYAVIAADYLQYLLHDERVQSKASSMSRRLYDEISGSN